MGPEASNCNENDIEHIFLWHSVLFSNNNVCTHNQAWLFVNISVAPVIISQYITIILFYILQNIWQTMAFGFIDPHQVFSLLT